MSKREWKNGPVNGQFQRACKRAADRAKSIRGQTAKNKLLSSDSKVVFVPEKIK